MGITKTLGGDRLGTGKKMQVELHNYERSTHDLSYLFRTTMSAGTLVPFLKEVSLPGDTWDIELNAMCLTHPTVGPLFGSFKVQLDIFEAPIRLYHAWLHNNKLDIGMKMANVKLPQITLRAYRFNADNDKQQVPDLDNSQINPSALLSYLDIRGVGQAVLADNTYLERNFNAVPLLAYWEIYKNYYANKQEPNGAMIHTVPAAIVEDINSIKYEGNVIPSPIGGGSPQAVTFAGLVDIEVSPDTDPFVPSSVIFNTTAGELSFDQACYGLTDLGGGLYRAYWKYYVTGALTINSWRYRRPDEIPNTGIQVKTFPLNNIDSMRDAILGYALNADAFIVNENMQEDSPYWNILNWIGTASPYLGSQEGLALKTYQSDLFNNWLNTDWIEGPDSITDITKIVTVSGSFTIDEFQLHKKVYDMLNRIAVSGGSYRDWLEAVWTPNAPRHVESPIYHGGLIKELVFQEVISNAEAGGATGGVQPLGTLAGRGTLAGKHKGGKVTIKCDEPGYIMGIVSITPRLDYSQGNKWDTHLETMDDFHKPQLDQIGFQESLEEQRAWWSTTNTGGAGWQQLSAGKVPAWIDYMTNVNKVRGNFAIENNEMFMVLTRRYEPTVALGIADMTTYIDPVKFNHIFAQTALDAQNFWMQISVDMTVRRLMSAKLMPNL